MHIFESGDVAKSMATYAPLTGTGVLLGPRYRSKQSGGKNPKTADAADIFRFE